MMLRVSVCLDQFSVVGWVTSDVQLEFARKIWEVGKGCWGLELT